MNKSSSFLVHLHLLHFVIIKKISIFKRKILHFSKEKSPKPYSKRKISNEQIFNKNFQIPSKDQDFLIFQKKKKKSIKIFNSLKKFKISKFFKKKKSKFSFPSKYSSFSNSKKKNLH